MAKKPLYLRHACKSRNLAARKAPQPRYYNIVRRFDDGYIELEYKGRRIRERLITCGECQREMPEGQYETVLSEGFRLLAQALVTVVASRLSESSKSASPKKRMRGFASKRLQI